MPFIHMFPSWLPIKYTFSDENEREIRIMKKKSAIILVMLSLLLSSCGSEKKEIILTKDNYKDYLKISLQIIPSGEEINYRRGNNYEQERIYKHIFGELKCEGVSPNYDYSNIIVTVNIKGSYTEIDNQGKDGDIKPFELVLEGSTDIAGNIGSVVKSYDLQGNTYVAEGALSPKGLFTFDKQLNENDISSLDIDVKGSVIPVDGTVGERAQPDKPEPTLDVVGNMTHGYPVGVDWLNQ